MLSQIVLHSLIDINIKATGDLQVDAHHTIEDISITLGQAFTKAIGNKQGISRYGYAYVPLDEALSRVVVDFSGRPCLKYYISFSRAKIGEFDVDLIKEFFHGFVKHAKITLHIDNLRGVNAHHQCETLFKAFGRALRMAIKREIKSADRIILPGQGAMQDCMSYLYKIYLIDTIITVARNKPIFGICVGKHILFDWSEEGNTVGLGLFPGKIIRFRLNHMLQKDSSRFKIPQIGYNTVQQNIKYPLWHGINNYTYFLFYT